MTTKEIVKITRRGMITIPLGLRKKFNLKIGSSVALIEDEGKLTLIPLKDVEVLREEFISKKEMAEIIDQTDKEEMELE
jgi:AbrB family looped-hinge helix DNA binding protein